MASNQREGACKQALMSELNVMTLGAQESFSTSSKVFIESSQRLAFAQAFAKEL